MPDEDSIKSGSKQVRSKKKAGHSEKLPTSCTASKIRQGGQYGHIKSMGDSQVLFDGSEGSYIDCFLALL